MKRLKLQKVFLLDLPQDVLFKIFTYLSGCDLIIKKGLVCKSFRTILTNPHFWRLKMNNNQELKKLAIEIEDFESIPNAKSAKAKSVYFFNKKIKSLKSWTVFNELINKLTKLGYNGICGSFKFPGCYTNKSYKKIWDNLFICNKFTAFKIIHKHDVFVEDVIKMDVRKFYNTLKKEQRFFGDIIKNMRANGYKFELFQDVKKFLSFFIGW